MAKKPKFDKDAAFKDFIKNQDLIMGMSENVITSMLATQQELSYGIVREYNNGTTLWFEPITDELDGFVLRKSDGTIQTIFSKDRDAYIIDKNDPNIIDIYEQKK